MNKYLVLLRGINVSGQKKIKMADFKIKLLECGYNNITTYLQSGNIILDSVHTITEVKLDIERLIEKNYNFFVPVYVTTRISVNNVVDSLPFNKIDLESEGSKILVTFLYETPLEELTNKLLTYVKLPEELVLKDNIIYIHCPNGYGKTKLSNNFIENKLKLTATTRNIRTLTKLCLI